MFRAICVRGAAEVELVRRHAWNQAFYLEVRGTPTSARKKGTLLSHAQYARILRLTLFILKMAGNSETNVLIACSRRGQRGGGKSMTALIV